MYPIDSVMENVKVKAKYRSIFFFCISVIKVYILYIMYMGERSCGTYIYLTRLNFRGEAFPIVYIKED